MKPTTEDVIDALGALVSCWSVPASDEKHEITLRKTAVEAESAWLKSLDILLRYHHA